MPADVRGGGVGFATSTKGYVSCGQTNSGSTNDLWEYDPAGDSWQAKAPIPAGQRFVQE
jgi:hypothetical protein